MTQTKDYYENSTDKDSIRSSYQTGRNLKAKYDVMNRYAIQRQSFDEWVIEKLHLTGKEKILDVGAGNGRLKVSKPIGHLFAKNSERMLRFE